MSKEYLEGGTRTNESIVPSGKKLMTAAHVEDHHDSARLIKRLDKRNIEVDADILAFAMRYAIGRKTFAPTIVVENIKHNIDNIPSHKIELLIRDIKGHSGSYGMECDKLTWENFINYLEGEIIERETKKSD